MNSEVRETCEGIAIRAGAIVPCPECGNYDVSAGDADAERAAYAMATNAWKEGEIRCEREELLGVMKSVLADANHDCPDCDRERD